MITGNIFTTHWFFMHKQSLPEVISCDHRQYFHHKLPQHGPRIVFQEEHGEPTNAPG